MVKLYSFTTLVFVLLVSLRSSVLAASLRGQVAFNSKLLKIAVNDWLKDPTAACLKYGGNISEWDTSRVYNMTGLFANSLFNDDISRWDVTNVRDFRFTFANATAFRGDLSHWKTPNLKHTQHMFHGASSFNSDLTGFNTTNVLTFSHMFAEANSFNGNVETFDITNAYDLSFMFYNAKGFDQDVSEWTRERTSASGFQVKWAQNMRSMFQGASSFTGKGASKWQTFAAVNMNSMFKDASSFSGDVSAWNVQNVKDFRAMFSGTALSEDLCWDVHVDAETTNMFDGTSASLLSDCSKAENRRIAPDIITRVSDSSSSPNSLSARITALALVSTAFITYSL